MNQFRPPFQIGRALFSASLLAALALTSLDAALRLNLPSDFVVATAGPLVESRLGASALAAFVHDLGAFRGAVGGFAVFALAGQGLAPLALLLLANLAFYFLVALSLAAILLPAGEYARILAAPTAAAAPPVVPAGRAKRAAMLGAALLLAAIPAIHGAELLLRSHQELRAAPERARLAVEIIGDAMVRQGTIAQLETARVAASEQREANAAGLAASLDAGFDHMRANVETYLDWYYSLPSEYARFASLLTGNAEAFLARRITETLGAGDPFAAFESSLAETLARDAAILAHYRETTQALLAANSIAPEEALDGAVEIETTASLGSLDAFHLPEPVALTSAAQRLGISVAGGGIAGVASAIVARRAANRLVASGSLRIAARALQVMAGRTVGGLGGAAAGAATGGAVGSLVPGFGTAIGAVAGGIIGGIGVGLGTDYLILKLEEAFSREAHRDALLAAIAANEQEARRLLGLSAREVPLPPA